MCFEDGDLGEGHNVIEVVDLLVDLVPDVDHVVDFGGCSVGVDVVEEQFGRHELVGVNEDDDDDFAGVEYFVELFFAAQVLHL